MVEVRLTHDDQMRQAGLVHITPTSAAGVSAPALVTRAAINRAIAVRPQQILWRERSAGGIAGFLALSRALRGLK